MGLGPGLPEPSEGGVDGVSVGGVVGGVEPSSGGVAGSDGVAGGVDGGVDGCSGVVDGCSGRDGVSVVGFVSGAGLPAGEVGAGAAPPGVPPACRGPPS